MRGGSSRVKGKSNGSRSSRRSDVSNEEGRLPIVSLPEEEEQEQEEEGERGVRRLRGGSIHGGSRRRESPQGASYARGRGSGG